jgi:hypothetical protein
MFDIAFCQKQLQRNISDPPLFDQMISYGLNHTISPDSSSLKEVVKELKEFAKEYDLDIK